MTEEGHFDEGESEDDLAERDESDDELVEEGIAEAAHTAYMFQAAKAKYWEAVKGRGTDADEMRRAPEPSAAPVKVCARPRPPAMEAP